MKNLMVVLVLVFANNLFSQDIITKIDGEKIRAKITGGFSSEVRYQEYDNPEAPELSLKKEKITEIEYENGYKDFFRHSTSMKNERSRLNLTEEESLAQGIIIKGNGTKIIVKSIMIFPSEVRYREYDDPEGPIFSLKKEKIAKIKYEDGYEDFFYGPTPNALGSSNPNINRRFVGNFIAGGPLTVLAGSIDYSITPRLRVEAGVGLISAFAGTKIFLSGDKNVNEQKGSSYIGLYAYHEITALSGGLAPYGAMSAPPQIGIYIPYGGQFKFKGGTEYEIEIALISSKTFAFGTHIWGAFKIRFQI